MNYSTAVDTLSVSFPVDNQLSIFTDTGNVESVESYLRLYLEGMTGKEWNLKRPSLGRGKNFFNNCCHFEGGFFAWGGNNKAVNKLGVTETRQERIQIYFDAPGCFHLSAADQGEVSGLQVLADRLREHQGKITRLDVALDFHNGEVTIDQIEWAYQQDKFTRTMRPSANRVSDIDQGTRGDTVYIGKRQNGKMFRAYEKGKQLGSIGSKWVRLEVELLAKDRDIDPAALVNHAAAFAQAYPYLEELCQAFNVQSCTTEQLVRNTKRKTMLTIEQQFRHANRSYGRLVTTALDSFGALGLDQGCTDRLTIALLTAATHEGAPRALQHLPKNLLQDCVQLHTLYSVELLTRDENRTL